MISGSKIRIDRWCKAIVAALALSASSVWAFDLPELMSLRTLSGLVPFTSVAATRAFVAAARAVSVPVARLDDILRAVADGLAVPLQGDDHPLAGQPLAD